MSLFRPALLAAFAACLFAAPAAQASLIGQTVSAKGYLLSPESAVVGDGAEFIGVLGNISFDFGADTLTVRSTSTNVSWANWGDFVFSGFGPPLTSVRLRSNHGFGGTIIDHLRFSADSITLDMRSAWALDHPNTLVFGINDVPEPATLALVALALGGAAAARGRRPLAA